MAKQYFFERGKKYECYNNSQDWFENVRDLKPHIYYERGEWHVVQSGHYTHSGKEICAKRNGEANIWMSFKNAEKDGTNDRLRLLLSRIGLTLRNPNENRTER